jgi:2-dehydropantoate 2-reductase
VGAEVARSYLTVAKTREDVLIAAMKNSPPKHNPSFPLPIAVVGAGAVGSFFGGLLAKAGHPVTLIGRAAHAKAVDTEGLRLSMADGAQHQIRLKATTELSAVAGAGCILLSVKSYDTETIAAQMAPYLRPDAVILSMQNGVDNPERLARALAAHGRAGCLVVPTAVYVAAVLQGPGHVVHHGRSELQIGPFGAATTSHADIHARLGAVQALFATAGVEVTISPTVMRELWGKLVVNCAYNAVSALSQLPYGQIVAVPEMRSLLDALVCEVVAVSQADGIGLSLESARQATEKIGQTMAGQRSSTAQDIARGKPTEIEHLNGFIVRRGAALKVPTPANQAVYALIKLFEARQGPQISETHHD